MAVMNRVYATLLVVLVVLCQFITAYSEKTPVGDLSSAQIEEQIQVGSLLFNARQYMLILVSNVLSSSLLTPTRLQQHMRLLQASQLEHSLSCSRAPLLSTRFCSFHTFLSGFIYTDDMAGAFYTSLALLTFCWLCALLTSIRLP